MCELTACSPPFLVENKFCEINPIFPTPYSSDRDYVVSEVVILEGIPKVSERIRDD